MLPRFFSQSNYTHERQNLLTPANLALNLHTYKLKQLTDWLTIDHFQVITKQDL